MATLDELPKGKTAVICAVAGKKDSLRRHLLEMGLTPGVEVTLVKTAPLGDPLEFKVRGYELTLRREDARNIEIRDKSEQRAMLMSTKLCGILEAGAQPYALTGPFSPAVDKTADNYIRVIRLNLRKDKNLVGTKRRIMTAVNDFESKEKYAGHIAIDVDPI